MDEPLLDKFNYVAGIVPVPIITQFGGSNFGIVSRTHSVFISDTTALTIGSIQSLDWTGGLDRWTGLVDVLLLFPGGGM